jgi:hypothetical protein
MEWFYMVLLITVSYALDDVDRTNNGLYFKAVAEIDHPMGDWTHSFAIPVPRMMESFGPGCHNLVLNLLHLHDFDSHGLVNASAKTAPLSWFERCVLTLAKGSFGAQWPATAYRFSSLEQSMCRRHNSSIVNLLELVHRSCSEVAILENTVKELLPPKLRSDNKITRGFFNWIGKGIHWLFGLATDSSVAKMQQHVAKFVRNAHLDTTKFDKVVADMQTLSKTTDERIKNILRLVNASIPEHITNAENDHWNFMQTELSILSNSMVVMEKLTSAKELSMVWLQAATELTRGRLPPSLVTPSMVSEVLNEVSVIARNNSRRSAYTRPSQVYKHPEFMAVHVLDHILIMVRFPLVAREQFDVYRIQRTPLLMPHKFTDVMMLQSSEKGMAIRKDRREFYYLSEDDLLSLDTKASFPERRLLLRNTHADCMTAIFFDRLNEIKQLCEYIITINATLPIVTEVSTTLFLFHNATQYQRACGEGFLSVQPGCKHCWVSIPKRCQIELDSVTVVSSEILSTTPANLTKLYGLNRPLVSFFVTPEEVAQVPGDWKIHHMPSIENVVPELKVSQTRDDVFNVDQKLSLKLSRAQEFLKKNITVTNEDDDDEIDTSDIDDDEWFWEDWGWLEYGFTASCLILTCVTVMAVTLCIKVNKLSTIMLMSGLQHKASGASFTFRPRSPHPSVPGDLTKGVESSGLDSPDWLGKYEEIIKVANQHELESLIAFVLVVGIGIVIAFKLRQCYQKIKNYSVHSYLALRITNESSELTIQGQRLSSLPADLSLTSEFDPLGFDVTGCLFPAFQYNWEAAITDSYAGKAYQVEPMIKLSWMESMILRRMLKAQVEVTPIILHHGIPYSIPYKKAKKLATAPPEMVDNTIYSPASISTTSLLPHTVEMNSHQDPSTVPITTVLSPTGGRSGRSLQARDRPLTFFERQKQIVETKAAQSDQQPHRR